VTRLESSALRRPGSARHMPQRSPHPLQLATPSKARDRHGWRARRDRREGHSRCRHPRFGRFRSACERGGVRPSGQRPRPPAEALFFAHARTCADAHSGPVTAPDCENVRPPQVSSHLHASTGAGPVALSRVGADSLAFHVEPPHPTRIGPPFHVNLEPPAPRRPVRPLVPRAPAESVATHRPADPRLLDDRRTRPSTHELRAHALAPTLGARASRALRRPLPPATTSVVPRTEPVAHSSRPASDRLKNARGRAETRSIRRVFHVEHPLQVRRSMPGPGPQQSFGRSGCRAARSPRSPRSCRGLRPHPCRRHCRAADSCAAHHHRRAVHDASGLPIQAARSLRPRARLVPAPEASRCSARVALLASLYPRRSTRARPSPTRSSEPATLVSHLRTRPARRPAAGPHRHRTRARVPAAPDAWHPAPGTASGQPHRSGGTPPLPSHARRPIASSRARGVGRGAPSRTISHVTSMWQQLPYPARLRH
jgi:hypothetical protein